MSVSRSENDSGIASAMLAFMPVREGPAKRKQTKNYKPKGLFQCTAHISQHHHKKTTHQPPPQEAKARIVTSCHLLYRLRALSRAPPGPRAALSSRILKPKFLREEKRASFCKSNERNRSRVPKANPRTSKRSRLWFYCRFQHQ